MAEYYIAPKSSFDATADAIREKTGSQATIEWTQEGFADAIENIPTGSKDAVWTRPADWPNLDALDISGGNIVYMTYSADEASGFCELTCKTSSGQYTVEIGTISGSTFTAEATYNVNSNTACRHYFGSALGGYKVVRLTGNLTSITASFTGVNSYDGEKRFGQSSGLCEVRGKAQGITTVNFSYLRPLAHVYLSNASFSNFSSPFRDCGLLTLVELHNCTISGSLQYAFYGCGRLVTLDTTGSTFSNMTSLYGVFYDCEALKNVDVSDWDTDGVETMQETFRGCRSLSTIDVSNWDTASVTSMIRMFQYCNSIRELDVSGWDVSAVKDFGNMFDGVKCDLDLSEWEATSATNIVGMFFNYRAKNIDVSGFTTSSVSSIKQVFNGARGLEALDISGWNLAGVTDTTQFLSGAVSIMSITIPSSLGVISANTFNSTRQLMEFHFLSTTPPTLDNTNAFSHMTDGGGKKIYVPYSADHSVLEAYQTATNWSTYAQYIQEEPQT